MNQRLCEPFEWKDERRMDRGKVMDFEALESGKTFGRYLDVDGDGIPFRTYPGTHPSRGAYFTRGTTKDAYARYSEDGPTYVDNMQRLLRKFETAKRLVPAPEIRRDDQSPARYAAVYFGSTSPAMDEALQALSQRGLHLDAMRIRAFPFSDEVVEFIENYEQVFVIEQNRDGQMRSMLINEGQIEPDRLTPVLHYDGTPITARFITSDISDKLALRGAAPVRSLTN